MSNESIKICHFTSVHARYDTRIYQKQLKCLSKISASVFFVVADGRGDEITEAGITIVDAGKPKGRIDRFITIRKKVFQKARDIDADIYQFHDPELLKYGLKLKRKGKKVIYDSHEDVPRQILNKPYLKSFTKKIISRWYEKYENRIVKRLDRIITATDHITNRFLKFNPNAITVKNYPMVDELKTEINWDKKENKVCYVGAIDRNRGIKEIKEAIKQTDYRLELAGKFSSQKLQDEILLDSEQAGINFVGFADRRKVKQIYETSKAGLVTLHPTISYKDALPVKMFEYMLAGIPVIASDIPLWKSIVEKADCGITVDPFKPGEIASAIVMLTENNELAEKLGRNGQQAAMKYYNWKDEEKKLLKIYQEI
ncbi:MAG: glycosyltransferase [Bacteroidales bacterium]